MRNVISDEAYKEQIQAACGRIFFLDQKDRLYGTKPSWARPLPTNQETLNDSCDEIIRQNKKILKSLNKKSDDFKKIIIQNEVLNAFKSKDGFDLFKQMQGCYSQYPMSEYTSRTRADYERQIDQTKAEAPMTNIIAHIRANQLTTKLPSLPKQLMLSRRMLLPSTLKIKETFFPKNKPKN